MEKMKKKTPQEIRQILWVLILKRTSKKKKKKLNTKP